MSDSKKKRKAGGHIHGLQQPAPALKTVTNNTRLEYRDGAGWYLPDDYEIPGHRQIVASVCVACRCVKDRHHSQVVTARGYTGDIAHLQCRACGHTWKAPIVRQFNSEAPRA